MFGAFRATNPAQGGLLWKIPHTMSTHQKYRLRKRLQQVDKVVDTVFSGLKQDKVEASSVQNLVQQYSRFPKENEMKPIDKYTVYNKYSKGYRKSVHRVPKWTKISQRVNPEHF